MSTVTERVAAGAAFLDEHDPDWWRADVERAIDLDTLDLGDGTQCILGQRCPLESLAGLPAYFTRYIAYAQTLSGIRFDPDNGGEALDDWAADRGFQVGLFAWPRDAFTDLTAEWKRVIAGRRAAA